jgi:hypothetical protein
MDVRGRGAIYLGAATAALAAAALLVSSCGGSSDTQAAHCDPEALLDLAPTGPRPSDFTVGVRVQRQEDVDDLAAAVGNRIKPRDVFVVDTEHPNSNAKQWEATLERVHQKFPCNRIMDLAGLSPTPNAPSYQFALAGNPELDAILIDYELLSWNGTGRGPWTPSATRNLTRIRAQLAQVSARLKGTDTRVGIAPQFLPAWDYGRIAGLVAAENILLNRIHRGYQVIQTQENCGKPDGPGPPIPRLTPHLLAQYRAAFGSRLPTRDGSTVLFTRDLLQHVGFEIAFSVKPNPRGSDAEERLGPPQAAACTQQILKAGGASILYWASPAAIAALFNTPTGRALRPAHG